MSASVDRIISRHQYEAVRRSRATDERLARRLNLPVTVVKGIRDGATLRQAIDLHVAPGTRVRLTRAMDTDAQHEPAVGEWGTAMGADYDGTLKVDWDGGSHLGIRLRDRIEVAL